MHPQIVVEDENGKPIDVYYLPERANIMVDEGDMISAGSTVAETPREASGISDITGGLPRVTEIFEARKPKDPAVLAEIDGVVEILAEKKRGKRTILVKSESGLEAEHLVPPGKRFRVHTRRSSSKPGSNWSMDHWFLTIFCEFPAKKRFNSILCHEIQSVYRSQRVEINDKHVEIIIARMLRKVKIESAGDTNLLPGLICDRFDFMQVNEQLGKCLKVTDPGDSDFTKGQIVPKVVFEETNAKIETLGGKPAKGTKPKAGDLQHSVAGNYEGVGAKFQLYLGCQFPGNDQGVDRSRVGWKSRQSGRLERKRDSRTPDSSRNRVPDVPGIGSSIQPGSHGANGGRANPNSARQFSSA